MCPSFTLCLISRIFFLYYQPLFPLHMLYINYLSLSLSLKKRFLSASRFCSYVLVLKYVFFCLLLIVSVFNIVRVLEATPHKAAAIRPPTTFLGWAWSGSFPVVSLMVAVETVVTAVSVATVAAVAAGHFGGSLLEQNFDICPNCLQLQQRRRLPSTTTIIYLSLLTMVSGIA